MTFKVGDKVRYRDGQHPAGYFAQMFTYEVVEVEADGFVIIQAISVCYRCSAYKLQKAE